MQPPTARELDRALREGRSPVSGVAVFGATTVAVLATLPTLGAALRAAMREMLTLAARADVDPWRAASTVAARAVVPLGVTLGAAVVAATAVTVAQTRGAWRSADAEGPSGEPGAWATAVMAAAYGAVMLAVGVSAWDGAAPGWGFAWRLGATVLALSVVDVAWRQWAWRRALRTTTAERRRKEREDEGDPAVKRERARRMR